MNITTEKPKPYRHLLIAAAQLDHFGIKTWTHVKSLFVIADTPGATTGQIAAVINAAPSAVHYSLIDLQRKNLVKSKKIPTAGPPANSFRLTETGEKIIAAFVPPIP